MDIYKMAVTVRTIWDDVNSMMMDDGIITAELYSSMYKREAVLEAGPYLWVCNRWIHFLKYKKKLTIKKVE